jgi:F-type H+-transporting ATPase subunit b
MDKILNEFGVQWILLAAQVVNFLILLFLLKKFLYGPLLKALEVRRKKIADSLKQAQEIEERLAKTEADRELVLEKAAKEAQNVLTDATKSANQIISEAHAKASKDIEDLARKSREQIKLDREKMQQEIKGELANLVSEGLKVVTGKVLTEKDKQEILEKSLKNVS